MVAHGAARRCARARGCYALALPLGINEALLKPLFPESHNLISDWYIFNHYLLLTLYGFVLASMPGALGLAGAVPALVAGALALTVLLGGLGALEAASIARDTPADSLLANVFTWTWLMVFLGFGRQYLSFGNRLLTWARDASYPIYILHQTVIIVIAYFVIQQPWAPWTKYWVVLRARWRSACCSTNSCCAASRVLRVAFGIKRPPGSFRGPPASADRARAATTSAIPENAG